MRFEPLAFDAFFAKLRATGLAVTVADRAAALELLAQPGSWDLPTLRRRLMLVLAHSADEQALFVAVFDSFFFATTPQQQAHTARERPWGLAQFWPIGLAILVGLASAVLVSRSNLFDSPAPPTSSSAPKTPDPSEAKAVPAPVPEQQRRLLKHELDFEPPNWLPWVLALGAGVPMACGLAAVFLARRRRLFPPSRGPYVFELGYPSVRSTSPLLSATALDELATALGAPEPQESRVDFDAERTALLTARRGGMTTLAHRPRKQMRRHLLLLQNDERFASVLEHLHSLHEQLAGRGVELGLYGFSGSPDRVWRVGEPGSTFSLRSLASRFDTLAVCGDPDVTLEGDSLAPGRTPKIRAAWLGQTALFYPRLWLTPGRFMRRSLGAHLLAEQGSIKVEPLALAAFTALTDMNPIRYDSWKGAEPGSSTGDGETGDILAVVTAWYERYLGSSFPLLCAGSLLPQLSSDGLSFLARRCLPSLSWDDVVKVHGLPWVLSGMWPNGLRSELRSVLFTRFPELGTRAGAELTRLLQEQAPSEQSAAFFGYVATSLEHQNSTGHDIRPEIERLSRGSARMREQLRKQPGLREWLDSNGRVAARLRVLSSWRFAGLALPLALTFALAVAAGGRAVFDRHLSTSEQYRVAREEALSRTSAALVQCWVDSQIVNATSGAWPRYQVDELGMTIQLRSELRPDGGLTLAPLRVEPPFTGLTSCVRARYASADIQAHVVRNLVLVEEVTFPRIEVPRIEPQRPPEPAKQPEPPPSATVVPSGTPRATSVPSVLARPQLEPVRAVA